MNNFKPTHESLSPKSMNMLMLLRMSPLLLPLMACQQTHINFTDTAPPSLPSFTPLVGAPKVNQSTSTAATDLASFSSDTPNVNSTTSDVSSENWQLSKLSKVNDVDGVGVNAAMPPSSFNNVQLHLQPKATGLPRISLVGISEQTPIPNPSVLLAAIQMKIEKLAILPQFSCLETIGANVTLHSVSLSLACPDPIYQIPLLLHFWESNNPDSGIANDIDTDTLKRTLKLNKHIAAFSGAEIDTQWRRLLLGESHPYNQVLDDPEFVDALTPKSLNALQLNIGEHLRWHLFVSAAPSRDTAQGLAHDATQDTAQNTAKQRDRVASQIDTLTEGLSQATSETWAASKSQNGQPRQIKPANSGPLDKPDDDSISNDKILYLIDAPGSVQTQVRVGYTVPTGVSGRVGCDALAALLGRSFNGRLYYDLREVRGLTYGIYGQCNDLPLARMLTFSGNTALQHTGAFVTGILAHLSLLQQQAPTEAETRAVVTYLQGRALLRQDNSDAALRYDVSLLARHLNPSDEAQYQAQLATLDGAELQHLAQERFASPPVILLRGDSDKIIADIHEKLPDWQIQKVVAK